MLNASDISKNIARLRDRIRGACARANRRPDEIRCVAVTKGHPASVVRSAVSAGLADIGENRVQEAIAKADELRDLTIHWHLVGSLQTNKVRQAVRLFATVQSVDRAELALALQKECVREDKHIDVLIQIEPTDESSKHGVRPELARALVENVLGLNRLRLRGVMAIGPLTADEAAIRSCFRTVADLFRDLRKNTAESFDTLSMGMSGDFEIAIVEGATLIRVGTAIFGERPKA